MEHLHAGISAPRAERVPEALRVALDAGHLAELREHRFEALHREWLRPPKMILAQGEEQVPGAHRPGGLGQVRTQQPRQDGLPDGERHITHACVGCARVGIVHRPADLDNRRGAVEADVLLLERQGDLGRMPV